MGGKFILGMLSALAIYALSVGPVVAYYARGYYDHGGKPMPAAIFALYSPLFRLAPGATSRYLGMWSVSDIEVYFIGNAAQTVRDRGSSDIEVP